jgi:hypothetical protein
MDGNKFFLSGMLGLVRAGAGFLRHCTFRRSASRGRSMMVLRLLLVLVCILSIPILAFGQAFSTLTDGATVTWPASSPNAEVTLGGNRTLLITGATNGWSGTLIAKQDATGGRSLTLPSHSYVNSAGAGAITLTATANAQDELTVSYDGTNFYWDYAKNYTTSGGGGGGGTAPSFLQSKACGNNSGSSLTCTFGSSVTAGQNILIGVSINISSSTLTVSDNCNVSSGSDTYTALSGFPTGTNGTGGMYKATAGANTSSCTITFAWTGSTGIPISTIALATFSGSGVLDVTGHNMQIAPGTAVNAVTSNAVTTTGSNDLCVGWTSDISGSGGQASAGTNFAWTLGAQGVSGTSMATEYFVQVSAGSITADFTTNYTFTSSLTGIACYEP